MMTSIFSIRFSPSETFRSFASYAGSFLKKVVIPVGGTFLLVALIREIARQNASLHTDHCEQSPIGETEESTSDWVRRFAIDKCGEKEEVCIRQIGDVFDTFFTQRLCGSSSEVDRRPCFEQMFRHLGNKSDSLSSEEFDYYTLILEKDLLSQKCSEASQRGNPEGIIDCWNDLFTNVYNSSEKIMKKECSGRYGPAAENCRKAHFSDILETYLKGNSFSSEPILCKDYKVPESLSKDAKERAAQIDHPECMAGALALMGLSSDEALSCQGKSMKRRYRELSKVLHADKRGEDDLFHKLDIAKKALEAAVKEKCPRESKS